MFDIDLDQAPSRKFILKLGTIEHHVHSISFDLFLGKCQLK